MGKPTNDESVAVDEVSPPVVDVSGPAHEESSSHGSSHSAAHTTAGTAALALGALGVVYGDIGTSPLYALREAFNGHGHEMTVDKINVYGICSVAFWALIIIISIKYLMFVMRADNKGEGGILALTALVMRQRGPKVAKASILVSLGIFGTSLLYGDGVITPAISVLSAVEGLEEVSTSLSRFVIPIAIVILLGLFLVQSRGTGAMGKVFGPIMVVWFATLAIVGLSKIIDAPDIIRSVNPLYAWHYFTHESGKAFLSLGAIFLVVTGGEALYADMGHFGRRPIVWGWTHRRRIIADGSFEPWQCRRRTTPRKMARFVEMLLLLAALRAGFLYCGPLSWYLPSCSLV